MNLDPAQKVTSILPSFVRVCVNIDDDRTIFVKFFALVAMSGWIVCFYALSIGSSWHADVYALINLLPFLFDIFFTFTHSDLFYLDMCIENYMATTAILAYNSLILLPLFWLDASLLYVIANYVGSMIININCSLTLLRVHCRCQQYLEYFTLARLPVSEVTSGVANRVTSEHDLTYSIANIKKNIVNIRRIIDYLKWRLIFTAPFFLANLVVALKTEFYSGYITFVSNFVPSCTPFLFLSLIVMTHNGRIWMWEEYNLVDSGCSIIICGVRIRHSLFISLSSFLLVAFVKIFLKT